MPLSEIVDAVPSTFAFADGTTYACADPYKAVPTDACCCGRTV